MKKNITLIASNLLKEGKVVAFPTETVYGLGADAKNIKAINKIYSIKNRPRSNPLIIHVSSYFKFKKWLKIVPAVTYKICNFFSPGAITILLKKKVVLNIL